MVAWQSLPGNTLLVPSGPSGFHLFFLVLGPVVLPSYGATPQLAMVSATSIKEGIPHDPACELAPGDHPFIQHSSYISYRNLRVDACPHIESMVGSSAWTSHQPCSSVLLARIVSGVCKSKLTSREFKTLFGCL